MTDPTPPAEPTPLGDAARLLVEAAQAEAAILGHGFVGTEHLLLALMADPALAAAAAERGFPGREELRKRLDEGGPPRAPTDGGGGLSSHARRLLEQAERAAGGVSIDRRWILDRLVTSPKGPLARMVARPEPAPKPAEAARPAPEAEPGRATSGRNEGRGKKPREDRRQPKEEASPAPRAEKGRERGPDRKPREGKDTRRQPPESARSKGEPVPPSAEGPVRERPPAPPIRSRPAFPVSWRGLMLLLVPVAVVMNYVLHSSPVAIFVVACLGVIPLAGYMGEATEHLSARTGPAIGGLLNATFGNAAELIIAIAALNAGLVELVKASITGSILGNLLLIMGLSFVAGGAGRTSISFNRTATGASAGMLALAVAGLAFPALLHFVVPGRSFQQELPLSEAVAVVLVVTYGFSLLFSLRTHRSLYGEPHPTAAHVWSPARATVTLGVATAGVVVLSEILVHSVEAVTVTMGLSEAFLGLIVIPLIGNAAEHATAVVVARKGQMDLSLSIALGSSTQVALLVAPVLVGAGLVMGQPMNLVFTPFEVAAVGLTTIVTAILTLDGEGHWFEGIQLLAMYLLVAAAAFFL
ncbi:MAG TPA: calcium/proton exchanger [Gemmatimonadales bacterium]